MDLLLLLVCIACICLALAAVFFRINGYTELSCLSGGICISGFPYLPVFYLSSISTLIIVVVLSIIMAIREDARTGACLIGGFLLGGILWKVFFWIFWNVLG